MRRLINSGAIAHLAFLVGVALKGLDGCLEVLGGIALVVVSRVQIQNAVTLLVQHLAGDPSGFLASHALGMAERLSPGTQQFVASYLLAHGLVKVALVAGLLRGVRWIFPVALLVLAGFIAYQVWRLFHLPSWVLGTFTLLDAVVFALVWLEWKRVASSHSGSRNTP